MKIIRIVVQRHRGDRFIKWLWFIIIISLVSKLAIGYILRDTFFKRGNNYSALNNIAINLIKHHQFSIQSGIPSIEYEPLYPFLIAIGYNIFGKNWFGITFLQAILFALTTYLLFLIGRNIKNEIAGFIAAAYHSFYPPLFFHSLSIYDTTIFIFLCTLLLYLSVVQVKRKRNRGPFVLIGFVVGLSALCRGSIFFILPPVLIYLLLVSIFSYARPLLNLLIMAASFIITVSPWIVRNYYLTGNFLFSTHGGFGFWQGNNERTAHYLKNNISLDMVYLEIPPPTIYQNYPIKPRQPKDAMAVDGFYKSEAIKFIKNNPLPFLKLSLLKFIKFWTFIYNPSASSYAYGDLRLRQLSYCCSFLPLLLVLPFGLIYLLKKSKSLFILFFGIFVSYTLAHMIIMGYSRLRLPLDPMIMILLGAVCSDISFRKILKRVDQALVRLR